MRNLNRRCFLDRAGKGIGLACSWGLLTWPGSTDAQGAKKGLVVAKESLFYSPKGKKVLCELCPKGCLIPSGNRGTCRVRENRNGVLFTLVYGNPCAVQLEPVERIPLYHVLPGSRVLCVATAGCNLECKFCQTWEFSQSAPEEVYSLEVPPDEVIQRAKAMGASSVAYTLVEPVVFYEYMRYIALLAKKTGLLNLFHSNGFVNPDPLKDLCGAIDAANIDLKGFTEAFYREICGGSLGPVLESIKLLKRKGVHVEISNLVIPNKNDDVSTLKEMCLWIKEKLGEETPLHFLRFYPLYKLRNLPPTPISALEKARTIAISCGLKHVYIGNIPGHEAQNTFCPNCKAKLIERTGYMMTQIHLERGACKKCGSPIVGLWEKKGDFNRQKT